MKNLGDIRLGEPVDFFFNTYRLDTGAPATLAGSPTLRAYLDNNLAQITTGLTLTVDFDGVVGLHHVRMVTTAGYARKQTVTIVLDAGTVNTVSVAGTEIARGTIEKAQYNALLASGRAQSATGNTLQMEASETFADNVLVGAFVTIKDATTGKGQTRFISGNVGSTDTLTVDPAFAVTPSGNIDYEINAGPPSPTGAVPTVQLSSGSLTAVGTAVWGSTTRTLSSFGSLAADTATAVWGAGTRSLTTFGTLAADTATAVWASTTRTLSSFSTLVTDIWTHATRVLTAGTNISLAKGTGITGFNDLSASNVRDAVGLTSNNLESQLSGIATNAGTAATQSTTAATQATTAASQATTAATQATSAAGSASSAVTGIGTVNTNLGTVHNNVLALPNATAIRNALLQWEPIAGYSLARIFRIRVAIDRGLTSGRGENSTEETYTAPGGGVEVEVTYDADGNRIGMTDNASHSV